MMSMNHRGEIQDDMRAMPDIDEKYWRKAILQRGYHKAGIAFERYRWALRYGQYARRRHGSGVEFDELAAELKAAWSKIGGPSGLNWQEACDAVRDSWNYTDTLMNEAIAGQAGFKTPPTFSDQGSNTPRHIDEPNT